MLNNIDVGPAVSTQCHAKWGGGLFHCHLLAIGETVRFSAISEHSLIADSDETLLQATFSEELFDMLVLC